QNGLRCPRWRDVLRKRTSVWQRKALETHAQASSSFDLRLEVAQSEYGTQGRSEKFDGFWGERSLGKDIKTPPFQVRRRCRGTFCISCRSRRGRGRCGRLYWRRGRGWEAAPARGRSGSV